MEGEIGVQIKPKGMMKSKLVMSLYRAAKPSSPPPLQYGGGGGDHKRAGKAKPSHSSAEGEGEGEAEAAAAAAAASTQKVISFNYKQRSYVHGPDGGAGDRSVDSKASSYISYVKERRLLEELVATRGFVDTTNN